LQADGGLRHSLEAFLRSAIFFPSQEEGGKFLGVDDVSLEVREGEVLGLIARQRDPLVSFCKGIYMALSFTRQCNG
jgi:hypothetical protein